MRLATASLSSLPKYSYLNLHILSLFPSVSVADLLDLDFPLLAPNRANIKFSTAKFQHPRLASSHVLFPPDTILSSLDAVHQARLDGSSALELLRLGPTGEFTRRWIELVWGAAFPNPAFEIQPRAAFVLLSAIRFAFHAVAFDVTLQAIRVLSPAELSSTAGGGSIYDSSLPPPSISCRVSLGGLDAIVRAGMELPSTSHHIRHSFPTRPFITAAAFRLPLVGDLQMSSMAPDVPVVCS
ncbi:hypothetical protein BU15DRAFT_74657 [Melanogaster broomeanus]|nr:hypothetical protein BU15DRAFT_74657 [Melanogaster broomeanus]